MSETNATTTEVSAAIINKSDLSCRDTVRGPNRREPVFDRLIVGDVPWHVRWSGVISGDGEKGTERRTWREIYREFKRSDSVTCT